MASQRPPKIGRVKGPLRFCQNGRFCRFGRVLFLRLNSKSDRHRLGLFSDLKNAKFFASRISPEPPEYSAADSCNRQRKNGPVILHRAAFNYSRRLTRV